MSEKKISDELEEEASNEELENVAGGFNDKIRLRFEQPYPDMIIADPIPNNTSLFEKYPGRVVAAGTSRTNFL